MKRSLIALAIAGAFLIANRAAFEGYFSEDDLDNLSWATVAGTDSFLKELVSPIFSATNTRPTGGLFYRFAGLSFGLHYTRYIPPLFAIHLLNAGLLFWIARRKGAGEIGASAACVFFLFHAALLEAWWKPMYIFDLLAASFCLASWLLFSSRYWLAALIPFWLAYKSKEVALFFPVVLALDHWKRAIPFFLISANFGMQALLVNSKRDTVYTLRFTPQAVLTTVPFYLKQAVLNQLGALLLAPLLYLCRAKELAKGLLGSVALMIPLLFLPARLFSLYLYVPMLPLVIALAFLFERAPRILLGVGLICFLGLDYQVLREKRKTELALGQESRAYVEQLGQAHQVSPLAATAYFENAPIGLQLHGMRGALRLITKDPGARVLDPEKEEARFEARDHELPTLSWYRPSHRLTILPHQYGEAKLSAINFGIPASAWQLKSGWYEREGNFRWASPNAKLMLNAFAEADKLRVRFNIGSTIIAAVQKLDVKFLMEGIEVGTSSFSTPGTPIVTYSLNKHFSGPVELTILSSPGYFAPGDDRKFGVALMSIGLER